MFRNIDERIVLDFQPLEEVRVLTVTRTSKPRVSTSVGVVRTTVREYASLNNHVLNQLAVRPLESDESARQTAEGTVGNA